MFKLSHVLSNVKIAFFSSVCLLPTANLGAYKYIDPKEFSEKQFPKILQELGANESLVKVNRTATKKMSEIISSDMVQGMAKGILTKEEWDKKYMRADALYIYNLGKVLALRAKNENEGDKSNITELADMFLGYGKHFDRLKKYELSADDILISQECDKHIALLSTGTSIKEFYVSVLTDMIPYVVFANYLLNSIDPSDNNPWAEYAQKYGDLNNKYAKEKLGKTIKIANEILRKNEVSNDTAEKLFMEGFTFEEWFIRNAFSHGFEIRPIAKNMNFY